MTGLDDLVDNVEQETEEEKVKGILDELEIESKEELEKLESRLDDIQNGLEIYDKRMEKIEDRLEIQEQLIRRLIGLVKDNNDESTKEDTGDSDGVSWD